MYFNFLQKRIIAAFLLLQIVICNGCTKLIELDGPTTSITGKNVFSNDATAAAVLTGIYTLMSQYSITGGGVTSIGFVTGLSSDELILDRGQTGNTLLAYYKNMLTPKDLGDYPWSYIYPKIFIVNSAIESLSNSNSLSNQVRTQVLGEAKFLRALYYFYLVNLYGDVPLATSSDYAINMRLSRTPQSEVWNQIIADLKDAQNLLSSDYLNATLRTKTTERVRPTKWAATALLARVYLYTKKWEDAETQASSIINQTSAYQLLDSLKDVFIRNNNEAIWQLQPVYTGFNTQDAKVYIITSQYGPNGSSGVYISNQLLNSFEPGDLRKKNWIDTVTYQGKVYSFAYKYKLNTYGDPLNEYHTVLRLAEQYLIRAEARAQLDDIQGASEDLNAIRRRSGLDKTKATSKDGLLVAILHERQVELFTEWGHRWLDLKRTNNVNAVMNNVTPLKGGVWSTNSQFFPIPFLEIQYDSNIQQNPGY